MTVLETSRLRLVPLNDEHLEGLHAINGDAAVMTYIGNGAALTKLQSQIMIDTVQQRWAEHGMSWWALLDKHSGLMVGAAALQPLEARNGGVPEIGWRLRHDCWHQGYATEAALAIVDHARMTGQVQLIAVCHPGNLASMDVMRRLGMRCRGVETHYGAPCAAFLLDLWQK